jgi:hypothetical protein
MSKLVKVQNGNYRISVPQGRTITLDVGKDPNLYPGKVIVTGDLEVQGIYSTLMTEVVTVKDNILVLNKAESGSNPYLTGNFNSGLEIQRGSTAGSTNQSGFGNSLFLYRNHSDSVDTTFNRTPGSWSAEDGNGNLIGIRTSNISAGGGNLYLLGGPGGNIATGIVSTRGVTNYERLVFDYSAYDASVGPITVGADLNAIPNVKGVLDCIQSAFTYQSANNITDFDTSVTVADLSSTGNPSVITFKVDNNLKAFIDGSGTTFDNIKIYANTIASLNSNNIVLAPVTKTIQASGWMLYENQTSTPSASASGTYVYSNATIGAGKTGLYLVNTTVSDELVSKKRALLFSMIF